MSFEHSDFDHVARFDSRLLGSLDNAPHTNNGRAPIETPRRPQLSLVPAPIDVAPAIPAMSGLTPEDDLWQEKALCAQTDPEAFFPEKGGSTREAKRICLGCEVKDACLDYALAHDERFGIWGGLSERERRRLKRGII
ncbi:WhiB family transcriptional regulator [Mycolicibacterium moriokaense]|jgi:WhiB family redox-sensing transcriptional regulator|uniref:Transcriptional regulator WhiB n=1 Tax=Mycolicibacterium moriokaense TaxID=39691 RepID=A0A318HJ30_9MYCO|nr:transcription factor WhiB [Mycolicibacterium moriokaense]